jgi:hypothetical protein
MPPALGGGEACRIGRDGQGRPQASTLRENDRGYSAGPNTASILVFSVAALKGFTM